MTIIKTTTAIVSLICLLFVSPVRAQTLKESNIHYLTDTTVDFNGLISKFKGKVIYVDIWATWCYPCRAELVKQRDIKAFSDFALKNDVVILYICFDRDNKSWKSFIGQNKLTGYHILNYDRLNKDIHERFSYGQTGKKPGEVYLKKGFWIPRHMLIDKSGVVTDSLAGPQGEISVYARLNKLLSSSAN